MSDPVRGTARAEVPARLLDLSLGGALLALEARLEVGAIHDFALYLEHDTVWVQAEVKRRTATGSGYEVGVEFLGIDPHDHARLRSYLDRQK